MLAADGRSASFYVGNHCSDKLEPIHQRMYVQRSGTSSHTSYISRVLRYYVDVQAQEIGGLPPLKSAAGILKEIIYSNRGYLSASMILSGWDPYEGYQIYKVNQTGFKTSNDYVISGSGAGYIQGFFDANYKPNMSKQAIKDFLKSAISLSCFRDSSCGGCIRLMDITQEKCTREFFPYSDFIIK